MNKRIQYLIEQATETVDISNKLGMHGTDRVFNKEKFAELIIAECCVALHPMLRDMISRTQGVDMIVNHFRGEE